MQPTQTENPINFSPLDDLKTNNIHSTAIIVFVVVFFGMSGVATIAANSNVDSSLLGLLFLAVALAVIGYLIYAIYSYNQTKQSNLQALEQFAAVNRFSFMPSQGKSGGSQAAIAKNILSFSMGGMLFAAAEKLTQLPQAQSLLNSGELDQGGTVFRHGHSRVIENCVKGQFANLPFQLFNYSYTTGSGKSQRTHDLHIIEFSLPRSLPHMIIDSLVEANDNHQSTLPIEFDSSQRITLEGDFSKYFHLYAPDEYGVTALTILAPDAMQALLEFAAMCDMEIIGNKLYFYWPGKAKTRADYENSFTTANAVLKEIGDKLTTDNIYASSEHAAIHSVPGQGAVLRKSRWSKYGGIALIFLFVFLYIAPSSGLLENFAGLYFLLYAILFVGPFVLLIGRSVRRSRLKADLARRYR